MESKKVYLSRSEIKSRRQSIARESLAKTTISVGDKRIKSSVRLCGVCHRTLVKFSTALGRPYVVHTHHSYKMSNIVTIHLCVDIRSCYANIGLEGET